MAHNGGPKPNRKKSNPQRGRRRVASQGRLPLKKLRRVLRHQGEEWARVYAEAHGLRGKLQALLEERAA